MRLSWILTRPGAPSCARRLVAGALAGAVSLLSAEGFADDRLQPVFGVEPVEKGRVEELLTQARAAAKKNRTAEAVATFQAAWGLEQTFEIASALAPLEVKLGMWRDAAEHLAFCLKTLPTSEKPARRKQLEKQLAQAKAEVAVVAIQVSEGGALVTIDGKAIGISPLAESAFVAPGSRSIEARASGFEPAERVIEAVKGSSSTVELKLVPRKVEPPPQQPVATKTYARYEGWTKDRPSYEWIRPTPPPGWRIIPVVASGGIAAVSFTIVIVSAVSASMVDTQRQRLDLYTQNLGTRCRSDPKNWELCNQQIDLANISIFHTNRTITWTVVGTIATFGAATFAIWPFGTGGHHSAPQRGLRASAAVVPGREASALLTGSF